ncbi:hypothetical protein NDU88_002388 [Pleurodeles waltl]|uniref:Uncharacterized protein n=1 Tax=Pleurodeles waltl TaxID=8319 RepID=A0AAV7TLH5_PLEWA|nr:hypothetical protein NDU88_002388 [Pleurodeles waltl]
MRLVHSPVRNFCTVIVKVVGKVRGCVDWTGRCFAEWRAVLHPNQLIVEPAGWQRQALGALSCGAARLENDQQGDLYKLMCTVDW